MNPNDAVQLVQSLIAEKFGGDFELTRDQQSEWFEVFATGYSRALNQERLADYDQAVRKVARQATVQTQLLLVEGGQQQLKVATVRDVFKDLCPIWPFC